MVALILDFNSDKNYVYYLPPICIIYLNEKLQSHPKTLINWFLAKLHYFLILFNLGKTQIRRRKIIFDFELNILHYSLYLMSWKLFNFPALVIILSTMKAGIFSFPKMDYVWTVLNSLLYKITTNNRRDLYYVYFQPTYYSNNYRRPYSYNNCTITTNVTKRHL